MSFSRLLDVIGALRWHQWSKNVLVFVPLILAHKFQDAEALAECALAFTILCMTISGTYLVNDFADLVNDRAHPTKRHRALASGKIPARFGLGLGVMLIVAGVAAALLLNVEFGGLLSGYVALSVAYSIRLRGIALLDVTVIGTLFTLRVLMGIIVADVIRSPWLLSFSMLLFSSLALAKRHAELIRARESRNPLKNGRGYVASDWPITLGFGLANGISSLQVMLIYLTQEASERYSNPAWLSLSLLAVFLWICRIWLLSHRGALRDDPVAFALTDPTSIGLGILASIGFVLAL